MRSKTRLPFLEIFHNEVTAWLVLVVSLVFTVLAWYISNSSIEKRVSDRFTFEVEDARQRILKRMLEYEQVLRGGVAFVETLGRNPTRQEWREYVSGLDLETYYPGIQGMGYSIMLEPSELADHIGTVRGEGFPDYQLKPEGERKQYSAIIYLEPFDWRNRRAFGYDMYSNPMRRMAMDHARDSKAPAVSGRVILVQETEQDVQAGFLVYLPVYAPGHQLKTLEQRREALLSFVYSAFRMDDLMRGILSSDSPDVGFEIYDGSGAMNPETLLYDSNPGASAGLAQRQLTSQLDLPGRIWQVRFHSRPSFEEALSNSQPAMIAIGGTLVDLLLFVIIWSIAGERRRVEARAQVLNADMLALTQRLDMAQDSASIGTYDFNLLSGKLIWDKRMFQIYGVDQAEFGANYEAWRNCLHEEDLQPTEALLQRAVEGQAEFNTEFRIRMVSGEIRTIEVHGTVIRDEQQRALRVVGVNQDVTEWRQHEDQLRLAAGVFDHAREGIVITDAEERILRVNPTFSELTGYAQDEAVGLTPRVLRSGHHDVQFYTEMWQVLKKNGYWHGEVWNRRKSGEVYPELLTISAVYDRYGKVSNYVAIFSDITKLKDQQSKLQRMAHYDALTQLPNRVLLADRMQQSMAQTRRSGQLLAICYLDLDGFKPVNDNYGHEVGDKLLVEVAQRLNSHMRDSDTVARLGGDEFVMLLTNLHSVQECEQALTRLLETMYASYRVDGRTILISASIGVSLYPYDNGDPDTLLRHADQAMYRAKDEGRNRFHLFDIERDREAKAHREALVRIEKALQKNEFVLHYQPKVDMRTGRMIGAEALTRWQHPEHGILPPADFLPTVEAGDFVVPLGEWVIGEALTQLSVWRQQGFETCISVNISGRHFQQPDFSRCLYDLLALHPEVRPQQLELEVLETSALEDIALISRVIHECQALGVTVSLDDFGTGYSSLTFLKQLPADMLKIDQSFVRDILEDVEDLAIIDGIIVLCQAFHRKVIAEGIESEDHGVMLLRLGCELGQGYGIARPMPAEQLPDWSRGYKPFASWRKAANDIWLREDLPLLTAEMTQRRWVDDLVAAVHSSNGIVKPPELDARNCDFGRWYWDEGYIRYGDLPGYAELGQVHERINNLLNTCLNSWLQDALKRRLWVLKHCTPCIVMLHNVYRYSSIMSVNAPREVLTWSVIRHQAKSISVNRPWIGCW
ncbi:MAG: EAL domain-containing protein [Candidatus Thiodiazotropha sp.]